MLSSEIQELARELAVRMAPDALLDREDVASLLRCTPRYVSDHYSLAPGFPRAIYLASGPDGRRGLPKWRRSAIMEWIEKQADGKPARGGRQRKMPA